MAEDESDILEETLEESDMPDERARILGIHDQNRTSLVEFYKQLVLMGEGEIPEKMLAEAGRSERMDSAEELMESKLGLLRKGAIQEAEESALMMHRVCLAHFLLDRTKRLEELAVRTHNVSLYCLYLSLEERVCDMLSEGYYASSFMDIMGEYVDTEPILTACSELCGLVVPPMEEILKEMQDGWLKQRLLSP